MQKDDRVRVQKNWAVPEWLATEFSVLAARLRMNERDIVTQLLKNLLDDPDYLKKSAHTANAVTAQLMEQEGLRLFSPIRNEANVSSILQSTSPLTIHMEQLDTFLAHANHDALLMERIADPARKTTIFIKRMSDGIAASDEGIFRALVGSMQNNYRSFVSRVKQATDHLEDGYSQTRGVQIIAAPAATPFPNYFLYSIDITVASPDIAPFSEVVPETPTWATLWENGPPTSAITSLGTYYGILSQTSIDVPEDIILARIG